ncbi:MEF2B PROTEIN [Salix viminalis]|uniref:MEF2B PROTEIN n=1 Tax=Salix viminalis TaxID=40686 RepID=A0A9Q0Z3M5_SALVM|nr:MEF2B PROTEIN [Salix viminalis]
MHGFSTVDGFVEITESLAEMSKYAANEPSVGLFYVQQHAQNAIPNVIRLKNNVVEKSRVSNLHTEDLKDSITMVKSMKECGFPVAEEMIRDIRKSLATMSAKQPRRGLINNPISGFQMGRTSSQRMGTWGRNGDDTEKDGKRTSTDELPLSSPTAGGQQLDEEEDQSGVNLPHYNILLLPENFDEFKADKEAELEEWLGGTADNLDKLQEGK